MIRGRVLSFLMLLGLILFLTFIFYGIQPALGNRYLDFAIYPWDISHVWGIFLGSFLHASLTHFMGNMVSLFFLSLLFFIQFPTHWFRFWFIQWPISSMLLFFLGMPGSAHIGSSIWVYSFGSFLITTGILHRNKQSLAIMFMVLLWFGGFFWGLLPIDPAVSWQGHISGAIVGLLLASTVGLRWNPRQDSKEYSEIESNGTVESGSNQDIYKQFED